MKNPEHFGWKFDGTYYIATITYNPIAPVTINFASCNFKGNIFYWYLLGGYLHEPEMTQSFKNMLIFPENIMLIFSKY